MDVSSHECPGPTVSGTEHNAAQEEAERLVAGVQALGPGDVSLIHRIVERARRRRAPQLLQLRD